MTRHPTDDSTAAFSMDGGDVRGWCDQGVAMVRCVTPHGDPVEMNAAELAVFVEQLEGLSAAIREHEGGHMPAQAGRTAATVDPMSELRVLVDEWCARRDLGLLASVLPEYLAINGLPDSWGQLRDAVRKAQCQRCSEDDRSRLGDVERALDEILDGRRDS